jgi:alkanesulfonate monooxygenase SsuD/methylene tetrahydromethanopterin reductase-like flavin-dependent oxidoreductase (luciferase family)
MSEASIGLLLPDTEETDQVSFGVLAEELGYDAAFMVELWGKDVFVDLATLVGETDDITIGTAIANVFSRSPAVLAMGARSLQDHSDGRFVLGTGVSTEKIVEDLHGIPFERPVRRAHETIEVVSAYLRGDGAPVSYENELISVADFPSLDTDVPIYHAALGAGSRRVVGRLADGWLPHVVPFSALKESFETIAAAAEERGRDPDDIVVSPYIPTAVDQDESVARRAVKEHLAYYIGSGRGYRRTVARRYPDEAEQVATSWQAGNHREARAGVTDGMAADLGVFGTPETARQRLRSLLESTPIIDQVLLGMPRHADPALIRHTVEAMAPG